MVLLYHHHFKLLLVPLSCTNAVKVMYSLMELVLYVLKMETGQRTIQYAVSVRYQEGSKMFKLMIIIL